MSSNILKYFLFVVFALFSYEKVKATAGVCSSAFYGLQLEELFTWNRFCGAESCSKLMCTCVHRLQSSTVNMRAHRRKMHC